MSSPAKHVTPGTKPAEATPLRFVTAASLFDGHDAAINIMRRIIQSQGAEVIHLGHNRSVEDVVRAALQEDADAIAISSYQGGHVEYFKYMIDMLRERGAGHVRVFGGGGGTITPEEIRDLQDYGVERIYHPNDGMKLGLVEMIEDVVARAARARNRRKNENVDCVRRMPRIPRRRATRPRYARRRRVRLLPRARRAGSVHRSRRCRACRRPSARSKAGCMRTACCSTITSRAPMRATRRR